MIFDQNILILLGIWFLGWWIYFLAGEKKLLLALNADLSTAYFFFLAALSFYIGRNNLPDHIQDNIFFYFLAIIVVFLIINHIYFIIRRKFKEPLTLINEHPTDKWLEANRKAIFVTLSHILFQQIIISCLIISLWHQLGDLTSVMWRFAVMFGLMHVPLLFFKGFKFTALYTLPASVAGIIFSMMIINLGFGGFILNYIIHSAFYVTITYIFWHHQGPAEKQIYEGGN